MRKLQTLGIMLLGLSVLSCSPRFQNNSVPVPDIPPLRATTASDALASKVAYQSSVFVRQVADERFREAFVVHGEQELDSQGDVGQRVGDALQQAFRDRGFRISKDSPLHLLADVTAWRADIKDGFPKAVNSKATLRIQAIDPSGKVIYSGNYQGTSEYKHAALGQEDVQRSLAAAMSEAVQQLVNDGQLVEIMLSF